VKILIVSKILVVAAYRHKLDEIAARPEVERLVVVTPPAWHEPGGRALALEPSAGPQAYDLRIEQIRFNGSYHLFYWPGLGRVLREVRPDLVHLDEEPYNLATAHGSWLAARSGARSLFFTWQNQVRRYPPPFSWFERSVFRRSAFAIAGSGEALRVLRTKGYAGPASVIPQFGVDPNLFTPGLLPVQAGDPPVIGFIARLVEEKGIFVLLAALAGLSGAWRLHVLGSGGPREGTRAQLLPDRLQPPDDGANIRHRQDALPPEHPDVGQAAAHVVQRDALVQLERRSERADLRVEARREPSLPEVGHVEVRGRL